MLANYFGEISFINDSKLIEAEINVYFNNIDSKTKVRVFGNQYYLEAYGLCYTINIGSSFQGDYNYITIISHTPTGARDSISSTYRIRYVDGKYKYRYFKNKTEPSYIESDELYIELENIQLNYKEIIKTLIKNLLEFEHSTIIHDIWSL